MKATAVAPEAAGDGIPKGGSVEGALKMIQAGATGGPGSGAVTEWEGTDVSLTVDNVAPEGPPKDGKPAEGTEAAAGAAGTPAAAPAAAPGGQ